MRELSPSVEVDTAQSDPALQRTSQGMQQVATDAEVASRKVEGLDRAVGDGRARQKAAREYDTLGGSTQRLGGMTDALTASVMRFAGPAAIGTAIAKTVAWADATADLGEKHRMSTTFVQQLSGMAERNGATFSRYAGLMETATDKIEGGNEKTRAAVRSMGLEFEDLRSMRPDELTRTIAEGIGGIADPSTRSAARLALFGEAGGDALQMLDGLRIGAEQLIPVVDEDMVAAGDKATSMWQRFYDTVWAVSNEAVLQSINPFVSLISYVDDLTTRLETAEELARRVKGLDPGTPKGNLPTPLTVPNPFTSGGIGGNSYDFLNKVLTPKKGRTATEDPAAQWLDAFHGRMNYNAWQTWGAAAPSMPVRGVGAGTFPGWAMPTPLANSMSRSQLGLGFDRNSMMVPFAGSVPMHAPGAMGGGGIGDYLKSHKGAIGVGLASMAGQYLGSRVGGKAGGALSGAARGAQMGMMLGPWGAAVGGVIGGVAGWIGGGKAQKNARNAELGAVADAHGSDDFKELQRQAEKWNLDMSKVVAAKNMKDFTAAVKDATTQVTALNDVQSQIDDLTAQSTVGYERMRDVVNEFGLDVSKLGPAFQQQELDHEAQRVIDAFAVMERGGADMNGVLEGMSDEISGVAQKSIAFGTKIPENMRPWMDKLASSGLLLDANGQKITDTSRLNFGGPLTASMDTVVAKLDALIGKLAELTSGFGTAAGAANELAGVDYGSPGSGGGGGGVTSGSGNNETPGFSTGGVAGRDFRRPGYGDVFPALLRRGETVLPPGVQGGGGLTLKVGTLSVTGDHRSRHDFVEAVGNAVITYLENRGAKLVR